MEHLIIYCHPNPKSFNHAVLDTFQEALRSAGHEVRVRDLYELGFDPVLKGSDLAGFSKGVVAEDVAEEQEHIKRADVITFISPIWWMDLPARAHGYIERVFTPGFAYTYEDGMPKGLLAGKKAVIISTTGGPRDKYEEAGVFKSWEQTIDIFKFGFCGFKVIEHKYLCAVPFVSDEDRKSMLEEVRQLAKGIV